MIETGAVLDLGSAVRRWNDGMASGIQGWSGGEPTERRLRARIR